MKKYTIEIQGKKEQLEIIGQELPQKDTTKYVVLQNDKGATIRITRDKILLIIEKDLR